MTNGQPSRHRVRALTPTSDMKSRTRGPRKRMAHSDLDDDREKLLALLNSHGQDFLSSFGDSVATSFKRKADVLDEDEDSTEPSDNDRDSEEDEDEEEWGGIESDGAESERRTSISYDAYIQNLTKTLKNLRCRQLWSFPTRKVVIRLPLRSTKQAEKHFW
jgi:hypothetical protein